MATVRHRELPGVAMSDPVLPSGNRLKGLHVRINPGCGLWSGVFAGAQGLQV